MIEHVGDLCPIMYDIKHLGLYRSLIEKVLSSKWCKRIMPYHDTEKVTLFKTLNCEKFKDKIEVVNLAVPPKIFEKEYGKDKISLLFLGTAHKSNIPGSFEERGGLEGRNEVVVWSIGKASREFLYVEDAAEGILLATEKYDKSDPVNLGANREIRIKKLVDSIAQLVGYDGKITWNTSKPDGQPRRCLIRAKPKRNFGLKRGLILKKA